MNFVSRRVVCLYHNIISRYNFKWFQWLYFCSLNFPCSLTTVYWTPTNFSILIIIFVFHFFVRKIWHSCLWHSLLSLFFKLIYVANMKSFVRNFYRICFVVFVVIVHQMKLKLIKIFLRVPNIKSQIKKLKQKRKQNVQ